MIELLLALLVSLFSAANDGANCQAISGQHADGTTVGVVVYGCAPDGVDEPYLLVETR